MKPFVHLHNHSEYSLLDGIAPMGAIVARVKELGMDAYALTDHGVMYGVIPFYQACTEAGIKPIIGCEVYLARRKMTDRDPRHDRSSYHLTILSKNLAGYRNLLKLVSRAHCDGFFYKPRVDLDALAAHSDGLMCLSGCLNGPASKIFLEEGEGEARAMLEKLAVVFGEDFYIELQRHGLDKERAAGGFLVGEARRMGVQVVATNDCHYVRKEDADAHDIALCIGTKNKIETEDRLKYDAEEYYIKSTEEMAALFADIPEAVDAARLVSDRCELELPLGKVVFPAFQVPEGRSENNHTELLRALVYEGAAKRYGSPVPEHITERLDYELSVIEETDYETYFLIVWDFIRFARSREIPVGPGRGSGAGSCVAYCLEITDVDPMRFNLLFERFLNVDRVSLPDFDIDFCQERREEVIEYVKLKYGRDNVAQLVTFNHLKAKAVIKAVGRAMDLPFHYVNEVTKKIPWGLNVTISDARADSPDLVKMMEDDPQVMKLVSAAERLEGLASHVGVHAAGIVISNGRLEDYVPVQKSADTDMRVAQYDLSVIEKAGLVKMDFLGLRTLTMLDEAVKLVREFEGVEIDLRRIQFDDEKTYKLFQRGDTVGVFQFERGAVRQVLREAMPATIEDISTINGLNRPGPSAHTGLYIENRKHPESAHYVIPELKEVLAETSGIVIYQEQVMEAVRRLAGFTLGQADILRWAMGKKKADKMAEMKAKFIEGCLKNGYSREKADEYFGLIQTFAGYGFNKCHSLPYSVLSYQTAYLKAHYPRHFMTALINSWLGDSENIAKYILEARRMGILVFPPDAGKSAGKFRPENDGIRFGLEGIKGLGKAAIEKIVAERAKGPFKSVADFTHRMDSRSVTKAVFEALAKGGAFDSLEGDRAKLISNLDVLSDRTRNPQQAGLFGDEQERRDGAEFVSSALTKHDISEFEHEALGVYLTGNPLEGLPVLNDPGLMTPSELIEWIVDNIELLNRNNSVRAGGVIADLKFLSTREGKQFASFKLSDASEAIEVVIFQKQLEKSRKYLVEKNQVVITGAVKFNERRGDDDSDSDFLAKETASLVVFELKPYEQNNGGTNGRGNGAGSNEDEVDEETNPVPDAVGSHEYQPKPVSSLKDAAGQDIIEIDYSIDALRVVDLHEFTEEIGRKGGHSQIVVRITRGDQVLKSVNLPGHVLADPARLVQLEQKFRFKVRR